MTVDPVVRAAVVDDLAIGGGADHIAEGAGVVGVDETRGVGHELVVEAGVAGRHLDRAGDGVVDADLVVVAAAIARGNAEPVRAAQSGPRALVGDRLAGAGGARDESAVATAVVCRHRCDPVGETAGACFVEGRAVVRVPPPRRVYAVRPCPVAGLGSAGGVGDDGAVAALVTRLHLGNVREEAVVTGLDEGGAGVGDLMSVIVHADEPGEVAVGTPRQRNEGSVEAALVRQVGSGCHSVDAGFDCRCALSCHHSVF